MRKVLWVILLVLPLAAVGGLVYAHVGVGPAPQQELGGFICPLTGEVLPCSKCCPLNNGAQQEPFICPLTGEELPCPNCCPLRNKTPDNN